MLTILFVRNGAKPILQVTVPTVNAESTKVDDDTIKEPESICLRSAE